MSTKWMEQIPTMLLFDDGQLFLYDIQCPSSKTHATHPPKEKREKMK